ncbi:type IV pilus modification protein PilV [Dyella koreensis]|uniref:Type IV pilus modification protein PilV n=1 Tax=Dyella koreensis TaxID=311235 RepID=A0ABW8K564_9GAMM
MSSHAVSFLACAASGQPRILPAKKGQVGVGLIEVLVAVLVLSIGFLGIAAMQAKSLSTNNSAMARSMATIASYSILDAMRADLPNAVSGNYNGTYKANACTAPSAGASLSSNQTYQWCQQLGATLGATANTSGKIACSAASGTSTTNCTITIQFDDSRAGVGGKAAQQVITQAIL